MNGYGVIRSLGPLWVGQGGIVLVAASLLAVVAVRSTAGKGRTQAALCVLLAVIGVSVLSEFVLTTWYLSVPGYMDHIEASVASNVHYFRQGLALYPSPDSFTFHGLLYGPLLVELNSLGYLIPAGGVS